MISSLDIATASAAIAFLSATIMMAAVVNTKILEAVAVIIALAFPFVTLKTCNSAEAEARCEREQIVGTVTMVADGDTIRVERQPVRLQGIAAPEHDEPGGRAATEAMTDIALLQSVRCEMDGTSTYGRCVGICYLTGSGWDLAEVMVRNGLARDCPRFSGGRYQDAEREAAADAAEIGEIYRLPGYCRRR